MGRERVARVQATISIQRPGPRALGGSVLGARCLVLGACLKALAVSDIKLIPTFDGGFLCFGSALARSQLAFGISRRSRETGK